MARAAVRAAVATVAVEKAEARVVVRVAAARVAVERAGARVGATAATVEEREEMVAYHSCHTSQCNGSRPRRCGACSLDHAEQTMRSRTPGSYDTSRARPGRVAATAAQAAMDEYYTPLDTHHTAHSHSHKCGSQDRVRRTKRTCTRGARSSASSDRPGRVEAAKAVAAERGLGGAAWQSAGSMAAMVWEALASAVEAVRAVRAEAEALREEVAVASVANSDPAACCTRR